MRRSVLAAALAASTAFGVAAGSARADEIDNLGAKVIELDAKIGDLDGKLKPPLPPGPEIADSAEFEVFNGSIVPGNHTLSVLMVYQGNGYGVFSYLKGYKFNVHDSHTFAAAEGKQTQLKVVGFEKGNPITTDPKDRPAIDFRVIVAAGDDKPQPGAPGAAASPAGAAAEPAK